MRMAVVGCGDAAMAMGLASRFVGGVKIVACVDPVRGRAVAYARRHRGARALGDWHDLVGATDVDFVYVSVPHNLHRPVTIGLARAGYPVLLEKPLAESPAAAEALLSEVPATVQVGVNYQYRYDIAAWALVEAVRSGRLGAVHYVSVDVPWYRTERYFRRASWHGKITVSGGGTLLTQGSHALDIALLCVGSTPVSVAGSTYRRMFGSSEVEDLAFAQVETAAGVPIAVTSSMVSLPGHPARISVYGSKGSVTWQGPERSALRAQGVRVPRPVSGSRLQPYRLSLAGFSRWLGSSGERDEDQYRCPASDALPVLRAVSAAYRSAKTGRREPVDGGVL